MPNDSLQPPLRYRFEEYEFRERTGELWRNGKDLHLPDQAGKVLLALLRAPEDLVTHEQLKQVLWPDKVCGDFEGGVHAAVRKLRRALDDDGSEPRLIGNLPRRGYRLLVPVTVLEDRPGATGPGPQATESGPQAAGLPMESPKRLGKGRLAMMIGLLFVLLGGAVLLWRPWTKAAKTLKLPGGVKLELAYLSPGEFAMGFDTGYKPTEVVHRVTLTHGFWMARTEITQAQWRAVMGNNPSYFQGDEKPVEQVSWDDCQIFLKRLNQLDRNLVFRLPTEAEWEYAARAGRMTGRYEDPETLAWDFWSSQGQTHAVRQKQPNPWGLYDMLGNVWEWCSDGFGSYLPYPQKDPQGPANELRTLRGGSCLSPGGKDPIPAKRGRVTLRYGYPPDTTAPDLGFRIVAVPRMP